MASIFKPSMFVRVVVLIFGSQSATFFFRFMFFLKPMVVSAVLSILLTDAGVEHGFREIIRSWHLHNFNFLEGGSR